MKIIAKILAAYLLLLAMLPCSDSGSWFAINTGQDFSAEFLSANHDGTDHNNGGGDLCSPFCFCCCCHIPLDAPAKLPLKLKEEPYLSTSPSFALHFIENPFLSLIWQPTKLS